MIEPLEDLCFQRGLRLTQKQRLVIQAIGDDAGTLDVEQIYDRVSAMDTKICRATVYRFLRRLVEAGILSRQSIGSRRIRYEGPDASPFKLIDVDSGKVIRLRNEDVAELNRMIAQRYGCTTIRIQVEVHGVPGGREDAPSPAIVVDEAKPEPQKAPWRRRGGRRWSQ